MNIVLHYSNNPPFTMRDHAEKGLGGTENFACYVAQNLVKAGHTVRFYNMMDIAPTDIDGIQWAHLRHFDPKEKIDVLVSFRMREVFQDTREEEHDGEVRVIEQKPEARLKVLILADTESVGLGDDVRAGRIDVVMPVGLWQRNKIAKEEGLEGHDCWMQASNGIDMTEYGGRFQKRKVGRCIHLSTPERGLDLLLDAWREVQDSKALEDKGIKPELHLFSSFMGWGVSAEENDSMCADIYARIEAMIADGANIVNHKHAPRDEVRKAQLEADVLLYPTGFKETYCITLAECMAAGVIPVVSNQAALGERIISGVNGFLSGDPEHDALAEEAREEFVSKAVTALWMADNSKLMIRQSARDTASQHDYGKIVPEWAQAWQDRLS